GRRLHREGGAASGPDRQRGRAPRLELRDPPHRPARERIVAGAACAHDIVRRAAAAAAGNAAGGRGRIMIGGLPLAFTAPWILLGLIALPLLWWLLRLVPPRPRRVAFPPTRIL